ncbi:hypothetical protein M409DRAFT_19932 [Zasmidium cellare ATCC 36951]|uniref:NmrA-like domain-containing protein n=1 Tax=Zasmidium cellare ATCC 36951 TaxID=1080233 RepID=A0A6A6CQE9_ZASCE|nr:uncharacterized protein M409DRAFT_19932 [Zasmidium cellare ATCC 36951]KAF2169517.1 hypothetical protein M409DRAFT_19932 [Zasmidium cellare ATCC 36951]
MSAYKKIAIAGATGTLGPFIVNALLDAGFEVTALSRTGRTNTQDRGTGKATGTLPSTVKSAQVDYDSQDSLVKALQGQEVVVSNLPNYESQPSLIDAAIKAGVKRFIPSEFGSNVSGNKNNAALPVFKDGKVAIQKYLKEREDQISYTLIVNGFFLDWGLEAGIVVDFKGNRPVKVFDGGNGKHSLSTRSDIGKAVAGALLHPEETRNRAVYIYSATVSQNEILDIARKVKPGFEPQVQHVTTDQVLKDSYAGLEKGGESVGPAMLGFILTSCFSDDGYGNDWSEYSDNKLLGIKELSKPDLEKLVAQNA